MKDLSDLPKGSHRTGLVPDEHPRFIGVLVDKWAEEADDDKPTAHGTPFRHSDAGKSARAISYSAAKIPASNPMDLTGVWNTTLGSRIHEWWQEALAERWPDAEIEPKVRTVGADGSGHLDAVIRVPECDECGGSGVIQEGHDDGSEDLGCPTCLGDAAAKVICYEFKTVGGYGFKSSIGVARKGTPAEGPNTSHLYQAALNAAAVDADETVIGYLSKEAVGIGIGRSNNMTPLDRIAAEWTFTREQYMPLAEKEAKRIKGILALVDEGTLSRRVVPDEMPPGAEIVEPIRSAWTVERDGVTEQTGSLWGGQFCLYCKWLEVCSETEPGRIPIETVREVAVKMGLTK